VISPLVVALLRVDDTHLLLLFFITPDTGPGRPDANVLDFSRRKRTPDTFGETTQLWRKGKGGSQPDASWLFKLTKPGYQATRVLNE